MDTLELVRLQRANEAAREVADFTLLASHLGEHAGAKIYLAEADRHFARLSDLLGYEPPIKREAN